MITVAMIGTDNLKATIEVRNGSDDMGFRCPSCKKDFGTDKKAFDKHFALCTGTTVEGICTEKFGENYVKNLVYKSTVEQDIKEILRKTGKDTDT